MLRSIAVIAAALPLLTPATVGQPDPSSDPPVEQVTVDVIGNSPGCLNGTVSSWVAKDNAWMGLDYAMLRAEIGPDARPFERRANCQLILEVHPPPGYTFAISGAEYTSAIVVPEGVTARMRTTSYFRGDPQPAYATFSFAGPLEHPMLNDIVRFEESVDPLVWAPCEGRRLLNISTELAILPGDVDPTVSEAYMGLEWFDGPPAVYHLMWRRC